MSGAAFAVIADGDTVLGEIEGNDAALARLASRGCQHHDITAYRARDLLPETNSPLHHAPYEGEGRDGQLGPSPLSVATSAAILRPCVSRTLS